MSNIPTEETAAAYLKKIELRADGLESFGGIYIDPATNRRATLDYLGRVQWWDVDESGRMRADSTRVDELEQLDRTNGEIRRGLDATLAALEAENGRLKQQLADCDALIDAWRAQAVQAVPDEYTSRGLERKYLNGDNEAAGTNDCADELAAILRPKEDT